MHWYVKGLESVLSRACSNFGLKIHGGSTDCDQRVGAWTVEGKKIGFIGIKNTRWVMSFGASLNVNCELGWFGHVVPCGLEDVQVTSLAEELRRDVKVDDVRTAVIESFLSEFNISIDKDVNRYTF
jgi:lipoyl(octanoyl) transferase